MSRIVLATIGSLGDLHPMIALALELKRRGHTPVINTWAGYEEKLDALGIEFAPLRPNVDIDDRDLHKKAMDASAGPEFVIKDLIIGNVRDMYDDLSSAVKGADLFLTGEIVYAAKSVAEISGVPWISTSLSPISMFSADDPNVYMQAQWIEWLRPLPSVFHRGMLGMMKLFTSSWLDEYRKFRSDLGLDEKHEPIFTEKFSPLQHLVLFSTALAEPQRDWPQPHLQTGFCFYDESGVTELQPELQEFLKHDEPPIVFTLGSAAVLDAGDFFDESVKAAKQLNRRAVLLYGRDCEPPIGLTDDIVGFEFAPYSLVFPHAACVVHQAGVGTTGQVLRAGVPHVIMPFSHDQPDNAARCRRAGVAEVIPRGQYTAGRAANAIDAVLSNASYRENAAHLKRMVGAERGTAAACDAIEEILRGNTLR